MSERRTRESVRTNASETMFTSSDLRGDSETPALARDQSVQVETEVELRYGGYVRTLFAGNKTGKPKKGRHSSGGDGGGSDSDAVSYTHLTLPTIYSV